MDFSKKIGVYATTGIEFYGASDVFRLDGVKSNGDIVLTHSNGSFIVESENVGREYAPILKPMGKFSEEEEERCALECSAPTNGEPHPQITIDARRVEWLCRNHYDIFGLISAGLAVDYYSIS
jgi:hypothetical protein